MQGLFSNCSVSTDHLRRKLRAEGKCCFILGWCLTVFTLPVFKTAKLCKVDKQSNSFQTHMWCSLGLLTYFACSKACVAFGLATAAVIQPLTGLIDCWYQISWQLAHICDGFFVIKLISSSIWLINFIVPRAELLVDRYNGWYWSSLGIWIKGKKRPWE